jgi:selenocysteine lyase/cysteine desulfurase
MADKFLKARKHFPVTRRLVYLDHAAVSPLSVKVREAIRKQLDEQVEKGGLAEDRWEKRGEEARKHAARLLKALFARGIAWKRGDNVVVPRVEFPANVYPWLSLKDQGVRIKFVPEREGRIIVEDIERAIDRRTRVVAVSFVEFLSGYRNKLELIGRLCRKRDVYLLVDGIQGVGALDLDVKKCRIDALSAGGHKWLLSPQGSGIFYCSSRVVKKLAHPMPGWRSVVGWQNYYEFDYNLLPDSRRYESAQRNFLGITGLLESLKLVNSLGIADVEARVIAITDHLCDLLRSRGFRIFSPRESGEKSGIVSFYPRKHKAEAVHYRLLRRGFVTATRQGRIRVSPHLYNTFEEMDELVKALP